MLEEEQAPAIGLGLAQSHQTDRPSHRWGRQRTHRQTIASPCDVVVLLSVLLGVADEQVTINLLNPKRRKSCASRFVAVRLLREAAAIGSARDGSLRACELHLARIARPVDSLNIARLHFAVLNPDGHRAAGNRFPHT
jgi:hypothetical protein